MARKWLVVGIILACVIGGSVGGYFALSNKVMPTTNTPEPQIQVAEPNIWLQLHSEWPEVEKELRPLIEATGWYKDELSFSEKVFLQGLVGMRWSSVWNPEKDSPLIKDIIEGRKFTEREITTRSGKRLLVVSFSSDISLAETVNGWASEIVPALEKLTDTEFGPIYRDKLSVAICVHTEGPGGRARGYVTSFGDIWYAEIPTRNGIISLGTLIHELGHNFTPGMPDWISEGFSQYAEYTLFPTLAKSLGVEASPQELGVLEKPLLQATPIAELEKNDPGKAPGQGRALLVALEDLLGPERMSNFFATIHQKGVVERKTNMYLTNEEIIEAAIQSSPPEKKEAVERFMQTAILGKQQQPSPKGRLLSFQGYFIKDYLISIVGGVLSNFKDIFLSFWHFVTLSRSKVG